MRVRAIRAFSLVMILLMVVSLFPITPGVDETHAPAVSSQTLYPSDLLSHSVFCLRCSQPYTTMSWDLGYDTGNYELLDHLHFNALGIDFTFYAADMNSTFAIDVNRTIAVLEALDAEIPDQYRRKHVESVVIILSSEMYCLDYEHWTPQQRRMLVPELGSYFTSEKSQQNVLGCCTSFPSTREKERVIWMTAGKSLRNPDTPREQVNCAYSYHLYCTEEMALMAMFIHEMTHALTLTVTMPSLEEYGFVSNQNWELQQLATGREDVQLYSVEALAYDITTQIMKKYQPQALFQITGNGQAGTSAYSVETLEMDPTEIIVTPEMEENFDQLQLLAEQGVFETLEVIEDSSVPLASEDLASMDNLIAWVLMEKTSEAEGSLSAPAQDSGVSTPSDLGWDDYDSEVWEGMDPRGILDIKGN